MCDPAILNSKFGIPDNVEFRVDEHGAVVADIVNEWSTASVARQGAQVLHWTPIGQKPVVWLSPAARFSAGKSMRGGVPVCWPWFGAHPSDSAKPAHGFARNMDWKMVETARLKKATRVVMQYVPGAEQKTLWAHDAELTLAVTVGERLRLELTTRNTGTEPLTLTQALHTYIYVGDVGAVRVEGLEGCDYVDRLMDDARVRQEEAIGIDREVDRIYLGCPGEVLVVDESLKRRIRIAKQGSNSCVIWNPWIEKSAKLGDMPEGSYRNMLCVETANVWDDAVTVMPDEVCVLDTEYSLEAL
jgi:glucose-6-phosphate 1-epimerase